MVCDRHISLHFYLLRVQRIYQTACLSVKSGINLYLCFIRLQRCSRRYNSAARRIPINNICTMLSKFNEMKMKNTQPKILILKTEYWRELSIINSFLMHKIDNTLLRRNVGVCRGLVHDFSLSLLTNHCLQVVIFCIYLKILFYLRGY